MENPQHDTFLIQEARDKNGNVISIDNAVVGRKYTCIYCGKSLSAKKGKIRAHHFAHAPGSHCDYDTYLHEEFKRKALEILYSRIANHIGFIIDYPCPQCGGQHKYNILQDVTAIKTEHDMGVCRPDIALFRNNVVTAAIEIVVTHKPEENALKFYEENHITLIRIDVKGDADLHRIEEKLSQPADFITYQCLAPSCPKCGRKMCAMQVYIDEINCPSCHKPMKVAHSFDDRLYAPNQFTREQLRQARAHGVIIDYKTPLNPTRNFALSNKCPHCGGLYYNVKFLHDIRDGLYYYCDCDRGEVVDFYECLHCESENDNILEYLRDYYEGNPQYCPDCHIPMKVFIGRYGPFLSCPQCRKTRSVDKTLLTK